MLGEIKGEASTSGERHTFGTGRASREEGREMLAGEGGKARARGVWLPVQEASNSSLVQTFS